MQHSSKQHPCKVCGRDTDGDCRSTSDLILCHEGSRFGPPDHLRPGDLITIDGQQWALIRRGGGFDGAAAVFRPHREGFKPTGNHNADLETKARRSVVTFGITTFLDHFQRCWDIPDLHSLTAEQFKQARQLIDNTADEAIALSRSLPPVWRRHPDLSDLYRWRVEAAFKSIKAQQQDIAFHARHYLGEVA